MQKPFRLELQAQMGKNWLLDFISDCPSQTVTNSTAVESGRDQRKTDNAVMMKDSNYPYIYICKTPH